MTRYTIRSTLGLALLIHIAGCDKSPSSLPSEDPPGEFHASSPYRPAPEDAVPVPTPAPRKVAGERPGPAERDPARALAYWQAAMEGRDWAAARSVFGNFGAESGMSAQDFAHAWNKYRTVEVTLGPGEQDAGAGSSFYEAPVTITGLNRAHRPYRLSGRLTLRRVNDVEGASAEQLRWHIERSTLRP